MARQRRIASRRHTGCSLLRKGEPQCAHLTGCQRQISDLVSFLEIGEFWKWDASSYRKRIELARLHRRGQLGPTPGSRHRIDFQYLEKLRHVDARRAALRADPYPPVGQVGDGQDA